MNCNRYTVVLATLFLAMLVLAAPSALAQQVVISISDPVGDDRGPGFYGYPTGGGVFAEGVFDLTGFEVLVEDGYVVFRAYFRNLGGNPWGGPNGWSLQYVGIFVRTSTPMLFERLDTFGLGFLLRPDYAWHYAILLAPGWEEAPVPEGQRCALYFASGKVLVQNEDLFICRGMPNENLIEARVKSDLIGDVENIGKWKIVVAVTSYDGFGPGRIRPLIAAPTGEWQIPATTYAEPEDVQRISLAILRGVAPKVMDLAVYSPEYPNGIDAEQQYSWLGGFDIETVMPAYVPGVGVAPQIITITYITETTTTVTTTVTDTVTVTATITETSATTTTTTKTVKEVDWSTTTVLVIIMLIIGVAVGYIVRKSR